VTGLTTLLLDDVGEFLDLPLGTEECTELVTISVVLSVSNSSSLAWPFTAGYKTRLTLFLVSFLAFLSLEFLRSSITRFSYGENPATSRMMDLTNVFFSLWGEDGIVQ
jgi:hypothetical protein